MDFKKKKTGYTLLQGPMNWKRFLNGFLTKIENWFYKASMNWERFLNRFLKIRKNWFYTLTGTQELEKIFNGFNKKRKLVIHPYKDP